MLEDFIVAGTVMCYAGPLWSLVVQVQTQYTPSNKEGKKNFKIFFHALSQIVNASARTAPITLRAKTDGQTLPVVSLGALILQAQFVRSAQPLGATGGQVQSKYISSN